MSRRDDRHFRGGDKSHSRSGGRYDDYKRDNRTKNFGGGGGSGGVGGRNGNRDGSSRNRNDDRRDRDRRSFNDSSKFRRNDQADTRRFDFGGRNQVIIAVTAIWKLICSSTYHADF